jgi:hypothetical protein
MDEGLSVDERPGGLLMDDPLLQMAQQVQGGDAKAAPASAPAPASGSGTNDDGSPNIVVTQAPSDPLLSMAQQVQDAKDAPKATQVPTPAQDGASWPGGEIGRQLGLTARAAGHGVADAVDLVGAPLNATINTLFGAHLHNPGDAIRAGVDTVTPAPKNALERVVNSGASAMAGAGVGAGVAGRVANAAVNPLTQAIASGLADAPAAQILGGAGAGSASQGAQESGANPFVQTLAGLAGGVAGGAAGVGLVSGANALRGAIAKPGAAAERVEPSIGGQGGAASPGAPAGGPTPQPGSGPTGAAQGATLRGVGAAESKLNPYAGKLTGEEAARGGNSSFPQVKVSKNAGDVSPEEQAVRSQIANEILGPENDAVRTGVITGNEDTLRSEYTNAKSPNGTPAQLALRNQVAREQEALSNYAQQRIEATGANPNLINNEQRGLVINDAFHGPDGLNDYFQQAKNQIYDEARATTGGNPIQSTHVDELLRDPQFLAEAERNGTSGVVSGMQKLIDLARTTGFRDPITREVTQPGSVAAWDAVRKSNNAGWTPDNARTIAAVNQAIDQDVAAAAGSGAYKLGDAIHKAQKSIMDVPAIAKVFGGEDANGIKDGVALERLPQKLNNMPLDQWRHIYGTLDDLSRGQVRGAPDGMPPVPQELQQMAAAARDEMKGALAREVYEQGAGKAGVWNQNSVNKTLNSVVGDKIRGVFDPDEVQRFHALNYAGQIMPGVHSYEGAALQKSRVDNPGFIEKYAPGTAYIAGAKVGGPIGGWVAEKTANKLSTRLKGNRLESQGNQLMDAMRANSNIGKN